LSLEGSFLEVSLLVN